MEDLTALETGQVWVREFIMATELYLIIGRYALLLSGET